jgi:hypothetical protein
MREVGRLIVRTLRSRDDRADRDAIADAVRRICGRFPVPGLPEA